MADTRTRKFAELNEPDVKLSILVPPKLDRELRVLAARRRGCSLGPMLREWIKEQVRRESVARAQIDHPSSVDHASA